MTGAAGSFLALISGLSENGFRTAIEIDTVRPLPLLHPYAPKHTSKLGTYNTIKATLPHIHAAHGTYIHVSAMLHYNGTPYQAHISVAKATVDALLAVLAVEEGPHGVRSNAIAPRPIGAYPPPHTNAKRSRLL
jgi:peroxisomal 2,4-dienoyl-CoA reductase